MSQSSAASPAAAAHGLRANTERRRLAAAAAVTASPTPPASKKSTPNSKSFSATAKSRGGGKSPAPQQSGVEEEEEDGLKERLLVLEKNFQSLKEEEEKVKAELNVLRDKLEEETWAKHRLEERVKELSEELKEVKEKVEKEGGGGAKSAVTAAAAAGAAAETNANREGNLREERKREIREAEDRLEARIRQIEERGTGGGGGGGESNEANPKEKLIQRCIVLTDSNGREATQDSIMNHVPRGKRGEMSIEVVVAYTLEEAYRRIDRGEIRTEGAVVLIDNLTNDVRGTRSRPAVTPQQLLRLVDGLRRKVMAAGAVAVTVCQLKPMQATDVTLYNQELDSYLRREKDRGRDGFGCRTMIRLDFLKGDGYHIRPDYWSVLDRTYACALLGIDVPFPTPWNEFAPSFVRQRWESEWPRMPGGGADMNHHGR